MKLECFCNYSTYLWVTVKHIKIFKITEEGEKKSLIITLPNTTTKNILFKNWMLGVPVMAQWLTTPTRNHEVAVRSLALLSGLRIWRCHELWCRLQTWLGFRVAMSLASAGIYSSNWTPSLGTSVCRGSSPRNGKKINKIKLK